MFSHSANTLGSKSIGDICTDFDNYKNPPILFCQQMIQKAKQNNNKKMIDHYAQLLNNLSSHQGKTISTDDYMFITNLEKEKEQKESSSLNGTPNGQGGKSPDLIGGFHNPCKPGGIMFKTKDNFSNIRFHEFAHEFGHWVGLPHAFRKQADGYPDENLYGNMFFLVRLMETTTNNYMDYFIKNTSYKRTSWTKHQLTAIYKQ